MKDLVQIIRDNPNCRAVIDNDGWHLETDAGEELADSSDRFAPIPVGGSYTSDNCYGTGIMRALAAIVGIQIESV